eukprot:gene8673-10267_t
MLLASNCPNLHTVDVSHCHKLTDTSIIAIGAQCTKLQCVKLDGCAALTGDSIVRLVTNCSGLLELNLCFIDDVGPPVFEAIALHCPLLRSFAVRGLDAMGGASVYEVTCLI